MVERVLCKHEAPRSKLGFSIFASHNLVNNPPAQVFLCFQVFSQIIAFVAFHTDMALPTSQIATVVGLLLFMVVASAFFLTQHWDFLFPTENSPQLVNVNLVGKLTSTKTPSHHTQHRRHAPSRTPRTGNRLKIPTRQPPTDPNPPQYPSHRPSHRHFATLNPNPNYKQTTLPQQTICRYIGYCCNDEIGAVNATCPPESFVTYRIRSYYIPQSSSNKKKGHAACPLFLFFYCLPCV